MKTKGAKPKESFMGALSIAGSYPDYLDLITPTTINVVATTIIEIIELPKFPQPLQIKKIIKEKVKKSDAKELLIDRLIETLPEILQKKVRLSEQFHFLSIYYL